MVANEVDILRGLSMFEFSCAFGVVEGDAEGDRFLMFFVCYQKNVVFVEISSDADDARGHYICSVADEGYGAHVYDDFWKEPKDFFKA